MTIKPTYEQQHAMDLFMTRSSLKINAFAGTGKTATLALLARSTRNPGTYLAFNRALAREAQTKFPCWVQCKTTHSLACNSIPDVYRKNTDKMFGSMNSNRVSRILRFDQRYDKGILNARQRAALVLETIKNFQQSDDRHIHQLHIPAWGNIQNISEDQKADIKRDVIQFARQLWDKMTDPDDVNVPLGHDGYLKLWALNQPVIPGDFILLDEAQDSNPVVLGVLGRQSAQIVFVGDKYQQIYEWRGAVNAMQHVHTDSESSLTQSFRFGDTIAEAASKILAALGEPKVITGNSAVNSHLGCSRPEVILCRTNAGVIDYTIRALDAGERVHVVGGTGDILRLLNGVVQLKAGKRVDHPELFGFSNWADVVDFSSTEEGAGLKTFVKLVDDYGETFLIDSLTRMNASENDASLILSTVHKAKGRQWKHVWINDDFTITSKTLNNKQKYNLAELRLLYVAITRAQNSLQIPPSLASRFGIDQEPGDLTLGLSTW
jgi:superfamily I DNA/RNA helicase